MSVEGASPQSGAETGRPAPVPAGSEDKVIPEGRGDVRGISDLTYRIITPYLSHPVLHRCVKVVVIGLAVVCLLATAVRLSPLPLIPVPLFGFAYYALRRVRAAGDNDRALLIWSSVLLAVALLGFWLMSVAARWVG
jgi:hypothetical protein